MISLIIGVAYMTMHTGRDVSKIVTRGLCPELYLPHAGIYAEQLRSKYKWRFCGAGEREGLCLFWYLPEKVEFLILSYLVDKEGQRQEQPDNDWSPIIGPSPWHPKSENPGFLRASKWTFLATLKSLNLNIWKVALTWQQRCRAVKPPLFFMYTLARDWKKGIFQASGRIHFQYQC